MRSFDETDMEILTLLGEDARRPFNEIADQVELSAPAVSDRVERLQDAGIINRFTVDIDRSQLHTSIPIFVQVDVPNRDLDDLKGQIGDAEEVEYVFMTADGEIWFYARGRVHDIRRWLDELLADTTNVDYTVTLIDDVEWTPSFTGTMFALSCAECGNTVDSGGESNQINGQIYHFCCSSCQSRFEDRYTRFDEKV